MVEPTNIMFIPNSKEQNSASGLSLVEISDGYKDKDTKMAKASLFVEQKFIQVEDIPMGNSFLEILLREKVSKLDREKIVYNNSPNISLVNQTNTLYNLRQSPQKKIKH